MNARGKDITPSSGNVFEDLGLPYSDELNVKAGLVHEIRNITAHRHLTQTQAADIFGTTQPKVSDLFAGKLAGFSMERLIKFLLALDQDVTVIVEPKTRPREKASFRVVGRSESPSSYGMTSARGR